MLFAGHGGDLPEVVCGAVDHVVDDGLVEGEVVLVDVVVAVVHVDKHQQNHADILQHRPCVHDDAHHSEGQNL